MVRRKEKLVKWKKYMYISENMMHFVLKMKIKSNYNAGFDVITL